MKPRLSRLHLSVAAVSASAGVGQATAIVVAPLLSRLYSPEAFGAFALVLAFVTIAATVGSLRLEVAIPLASPPEARTLARAAAVSSMVAGVICLVALVLWMPDETWQPTLIASMVVVYLVWVTAMYAVLTSYSLRARRYHAVARRNLLQQAGTALSQLTFSALSRSATGLTAGLAVGRSLGVGALALESRVLSRGHGEYPSTRATLRRYWRFPCLFAPSALLNVLGLQLPIIVVTSRYGTDSAGNLAQAMTFTLMPAALLGTAAANVVMGELAERVRAGDLHQSARYWRVTKALAPFAAGWLVVVVVGAPKLLPIVLGPAWTTSGQYAAALAVAAATGLIASPLSIVLGLYERSRANFILDVARVVLVFGAGTAAWAAGMGPVAAVLAMSLAMSVVYVLSWGFCLLVVSGSRSTGKIGLAKSDVSGK